MQIQRQQEIKQQLKTKLDYDFTQNWTQEQLERQHELILKYGPKETSYCAAFDAKDFDLLVKFSEAIHAGNNYLSEYFFNQLEAKYNDHQACIEYKSQKANIDKISRTEDIPTVHGLAWCNKLHIQGNGTATYAKWRYVNAGSDDREARAYQQQLFGAEQPNTRMDTTVAAQGSITTSSQSLRVIGIFPTTFPTITVRESAVVNASSGGTLLNRNSFPSSPIAHTVNGQTFTIGSVFTFNIVSKWG